ncbi:Hypothetical protein D9617_3g021060 [Elsinoe fawcettii]|nr:Hypothetical protein D9617_3g021060 [Elsinoe fawcettii]
MVVSSLSPTVTLLENDPGLPRSNPTQAFWQLPPHRLANHQSPSLPSHADVVVIGSGIAGCSVTNALLETDDNEHVVVLEARTLTSGATGRNGGHLKSAAVQEYEHMLRHYGRESARDITEYMIRNIQRVREVAKSLNLEECSELREVQGISTALGPNLDGFTSSLSLFEQNHPDQKGKYKLVPRDQTKLLQAPRCTGLSGMTPADGIFSQEQSAKYACGTLTGPAGAMWPYRLVTGIFECLLEQYQTRLSIETSTPVLSVERTASTDSDDHKYTLTTPRGLIRARKIVYCTNGHTGHLLPQLRGGAFPYERKHDCPEARQVLPIRIISTGLYYVTQNEKTGDIFVGGEHETAEGLVTGDDSVVGKNSQDNLARLLPELYGDCGWERPEERVKSRWSGIMGFTSDGLPLVGRVPATSSSQLGKSRQDDTSIASEDMGEDVENQQWLAVGFNGYGMANAWLCGEAVVGMMRGPAAMEAQGVDKWFPKAYWLTEERMERLSAEKSAEALFDSLPPPTLQD